MVLLFFVLSASASLAHPYYVSICQIEYNRETHALEISLKVFADDLLLGLEKAGHKEVFLGEERENPNTDSHINEYVHSKLKFEVNGNPVEYKFIGKELEDDVVWSYFEISNVEELKTIDVQCTLLTEIHETQSNVIQVDKDKNIKNLLLGRRKTSGVLSFED
ncbi:DUF6702 family protein [Maribellus sediminis]|uniref:DUF6702 family protein n=1 Tax=Maribellus sediminis TaxID=2696285 RepID=UPI0014300678|nr:DUF6702 family protein [Maribellus sediminis]